MKVVKRDGSVEACDKRKIVRSVERACKGLSDVLAEEVADETTAGLYDGISTSDIDRASILAARSKIAYEPNYSYVAARLLLYSLYREVFGHRVDGRSSASDCRKTFVVNVLTMVKDGQLDGRLTAKFDLCKLADAIKPERDLQFKYLGLQTLYDRYFIHKESRRLETPQAFWMRVAMGLCLNEADPTTAAIDAYNLSSTFRCCPATPTLFNSGTPRPQLSSCYLSTLEDSIDGIYGTLHDQARLSKFAGGMGVDMTPLRATGSHIKGTNGKSQGIVPWARQFNDMAVAVNQGGKRKGAIALYLETWHLDIFEFLDLLKNTGDERRRCHDVHTANWIPDLFMKQVREDGPWYLFSPDECPDLHETWGDTFEAVYWEYVRKAKLGQIKNWKAVRAKELWKKTLGAIKETGHPWVTFKDPSNIRYANQHVGVVHNSNLCTEVIEHCVATTYDEQEVVELGETAVCNLCSINYVAHADKDGDIDFDLLAETVMKAVRLLDNVIDLNYYPTKEAQKSNLQNRPVGLGRMGWHDLLHRRKLAFDSREAEDLANRLEEFVSYYAILTSSGLAAERGAYPNYEGSLWSKGKLPHDTWADLMERRGDPFETPPHTMDWTSVREKVSKDGMRNGLVCAIAPTATISFIVGCSQSVEPDYSVLFVYSTLSGEFTMANEFFVNELKTLGAWDEGVVKTLHSVDGDVSRMVLPSYLKERFKTAFDVDQKRLIDIAAARQKWIDQGQSLNLYYAGDSMKALSDLYFHAWDKGLKTTYYLRTKAASRVEKASVSRNGTASSCKIGSLMETCESCQ